MISLPGLCLTTGRTKVAREILASYAAFVSEGMLPNRFPDEGEAPEYNTVDATLWYFEAIRGYVQTATDGPKLARELWPTLKDIVDWHIRGTRYGIGVDEADGLLRAGVPGWQLTWMDARVGDREITPRIGKPVEVNALWYNALCTMEALASQLGEDSREYRRRAEQVKGSFRAAFLRPDRRGLYDVLAEEGPDASLRPNQIFAVSLPHSPLVKDDQKMVVRAVEQTLLTPFGLRSLAPEDPAYCPRYGGNSAERDSAYHQGTVWPWLLGPFALAHYRAYGNRDRALGFLRSLEAHLRDAGIGFISEIFDAEPPHAPNGCIAQAWSIAETLRALKSLEAGA
jgi:predicted glycogen debranching enzyme